MSGRLIAVVGPSGAGKDTLIAAARRLRPELIWARRVITRPEAAGGEPHESVARDEFERRRAAGGFAVWWEAHGLLYGVPAEVEDQVVAGRTVIFNGSRGAIGQARIRFPQLEIVVVTAPPAALAKRLSARGRETAEDIEARLSRAAYPAPQDARVVINDETVEIGAERLLRAFNLSAAGAV